MYSMYVCMYVCDVNVVNSKSVIASPLVSA